MSPGHNITLFRPHPEHFFLSARDGLTSIGFVLPFDKSSPMGRAGPQQASPSPPPPPAPPWSGC